ncbi:MAG: GspMb/PilO family protein [Candidatus Omnitrophica bacterium]|nr:GspMb/PilO family protein [Candidatus Omnitrophota bacterium]
MIRNITKREKILAAFTVSVTLIALVYNFIIDPIISQWNALDKKIRDKESALKKYSRILGDKENIERLRTQYAKYLGSKKMTLEEESAVALSSIEKTARQTSVRITNIKPLSSKSFGNYNKFTFRVATESKLTELTKFIYDLQSSDQLLKVERMVLRAKENEPATIKSILNITKVSVF